MRGLRGKASMTFLLVGAQGIDKPSAHPSLERLYGN